MPEEIFDVVDAQDRVIGQARRSEVHARGLLHRAVHVFVFNSRDQLLVQMRSAAKDEFPLTWTSSCSGHLSAGESYEAAAPRELAEEVGLSADLHFVSKFAASRALANEHTVLYRTTSDDPPVFDAQEIERLAFYRLPELEEMLERDTAQFSPPFAFLLRWFLANGNA